MTTSVAASPMPASSRSALRATIAGGSTPFAFPGSVRGDAGRASRSGNETWLPEYVTRNLSGAPSASPSFSVVPVTFAMVVTTSEVFEGSTVV